MGKISMTVCDTERGVKKLEMCHSNKECAYKKVTFFARLNAGLSHSYEHVYSTCSSTALQKPMGLEYPIKESKLSGGLKRGKDRLCR